MDAAACERKARKALWSAADLVADVLRVHLQYDTEPLSRKALAELVEDLERGIRRANASLAPLGIRANGTRTDEPED